MYLCIFVFCPVLKVYLIEYQSLRISYEPNKCLCVSNSGLEDINNLQKIVMVMKEGQITDRDRLPIKKVVELPEV